MLVRRDSRPSRDLKLITEWTLLASVAKQIPSESARDAFARLPLARVCLRGISVGGVGLRAAASKIDDEERYEKRQGCYSHGLDFCHQLQPPEFSLPRMLAVSTIVASRQSVVAWTLFRNSSQFTYTPTHLANNISFALLELLTSCLNTLA